MLSISVSKLVKSLVASSMLLAALASAGAAMADTPGPNTLDIRGSTTLFPFVNQSKDQFVSDSPTTIISLSQGGSGTGQSWILSGQIDVAMSSGTCSDANAGLNGAGPAIYSCSDLQKDVVGRDGLTMIVKQGTCMAQANGGSPTITRNQISAIYGGSITDWNAIFTNCPVGTTIIPRSRATNSGTYASHIDMLKSRTPPLTVALEAATIAAQPAPYNVRLPGNPDVQNAILNDSTGRMIGYVGLAFDAGVKDLKVENISSSVETVSNGTYPLGRNLWLFTTPGHKQRITDYINWILSVKGQAAVEDSGYVTVGLIAKDYDVNGDRSIDVGDLVSVGNNWNTTGPIAWWIRADVNRDASISVGDLVTVGNHWNETY